MTTKTEVEKLKASRKVSQLNAGKFSILERRSSTTTVNPLSILLMPLAPEKLSKSTNSALCWE